MSFLIVVAAGILSYGVHALQVYGWLPGMNNVAYRAKSFLGDEYTQVRMGLRMNIIGSLGVEGVAEPGDIASKKTALQEAYDLGARLCGNK